MNHFRSIKYLPAILVGKILLIGTLCADVIQFFDPTTTSKNKDIQFNLKTFLANDPVSIKEFLNDWGGEYSSKNGKNIALLDSRFDLGYSVWENYYLGYFYQYDLFIDTDKEFTKLFYTIKNKNDLETDKRYKLRLDIEGIKQNGLVLSNNSKLFEDNKYSIGFGVAFYLSYGLDMQNGIMHGDAKTISAKNYDIDAASSYYYTHNYLYDLDTTEAYGYGYGSHLGLYFEDKKYGFKIKFLVNNLFTKMYWKDLPYSKVLLKTQNKSHDESGYVKYAPTISGLEQYRDYTQKLTPKYKLESSILLDKNKIFGGMDFVYNEKFPYIGILHQLDDCQTIDMMYENRFGSFEFGYGYKTFKISILANEFSDISAFGFSTSFVYKFSKY